MGVPTLQGADLRWSVELSDATSALAVQPGDGLVAVGSLGGEAVVLDPAYGQVVATLPGHDFGVLSVAWSPDGDRLAVGGADGRLAVREPDGTRVADVTLQGWVGALAWSADGTRLAVASGRDVHVVDRDGAGLRQYPGQRSTVTDVAWAGSRNRLGVAAYGGLRWYEPDDVRDDPVKDFDWKGSLLVLEVSPDQRWAASGNQDSSVHVWRLWSGEDLEMTGYPSKVAALAWDRSSRWLAAAGSNDVTVWDHAGRGPQGRAPVVLETHGSLVTALAYQHQGPLLASGARDGVVAVWPAAGVGVGRAVSRASARRGGPTPGPKPLVVLRPAAPVGAVEWSVDDRDVLVAGDDGTLRCWRVADA